MSRAVKNLYAHLASSSSPLAASVSEGIYAYALSQKDDAVLASLARRLDLPSRLVEELGRMKGAKVRAAYLSRPDREESELLTAVRSEKRVTVLAAMAGSPEASPALLEALSQAGSRLVAAALLSNEACPDGARLAALRTLAEHADSLSWQMRSQFEELVRATPELHDELLARDDLRDWVVRLLVESEHLSAATRDRLVQRLVLTPLATAAAKRPQRDWAAQQVVNNAVNEALRILQCSHFTLDQAARAGEAAAAVTDVAPHVQSLLAEALAARGLGSGGLNEDIVAARTSTDSAALAALATMCLDRAEEERNRLSTTRHHVYGHRPNPELTALAATLISNPSTPSGSAVALLSLAYSSSPLQVVLARPSDPDFTASALLAGQYVMHEPAVVEHLRTHRATLLALLARLGASSDRMGVGFAISLVCSAGLIDESMVRDLPWWVLTDTAGALAPPYGYRGEGAQEPVDLTAVLSVILAEELGVDPARWEIFSVVGETFEGTLGELLELCQMAQPDRG